MDKLKVLAIEPFYGGSHKKFLEGLKSHSRHQFSFLTLSDHHWKWRVRSSPFIFSDQIASENLAVEEFDVLLLSSFLDLAVFKGMVGKRLEGIPTVLFMHENQVSYPVRDSQERDHHFAFTNFSSLACADHVWWNSAWHRKDFLDHADQLIGRFPSKIPDSWRIKAEHGSIMHLGIESPDITARQVSSQNSRPVLRILWNHRWEHDKRPDLFFNALGSLQQKSLPFEVVLLGERYAKIPKEFVEAKIRFKDQIVRWEYAESRVEYWELLNSCDLAVSTTDHEFFGLSMVEAAYAGCLPVIPAKLSYPEVFSRLDASLKKDCFYRSQDELVARLVSFAENPSRARSLSARNAVSQYEWERIIVSFDKEFARITNGPQS